MTFGVHVISFHFPMHYFLCDSIIHHCFRHLTFIAFLSLVKISVRNRKCFLREVFSSEESKRRETNMSSKNNNQINVPQAREAMDKFKMLFCPRSVST